MKNVASNRNPVARIQSTILRIYKESNEQLEKDFQKQIYWIDRCFPKKGKRKNSVKKQSPTNVKRPRSTSDNGNLCNDANPPRFTKKLKTTGHFEEKKQTKNSSDENLNVKPNGGEIELKDIGDVASSFVQNMDTSSKNVEATLVVEPQKEVYADMKSQIKPKKKRIDISKLRVVDLRVELKKRGLKSSGLKKVLVDRLKEAIEAEEKDEEKEDNKKEDELKEDEVTEADKNVISLNAPPTGVEANNEIDTEPLRIINKASSVVLSSKVDSTLPVSYNEQGVINFEVKHTESPARLNNTVVTCPNSSDCTKDSEIEGKKLQKVASKCEIDNTYVPNLNSSGGKANLLEDIVSEKSDIVDTTDCARNVTESDEGIIPHITVGKPSNVEQSVGVIIEKQSNDVADSVSSLEVNILSPVNRKSPIHRKEDNRISLLSPEIKCTNITSSSRRNEQTSESTDKEVILESLSPSVDCKNDEKGEHTKEEIKLLPNGEAIGVTAKVEDDVLQSSSIGDVEVDKTRNNELITTNSDSEILTKSPSFDSFLSDRKVPSKAATKETSLSSKSITSYHLNGSIVEDSEENNEDMMEISGNASNQSSDIFTKSHKKISPFARPISSIKKRQPISPLYSSKKERQRVVSTKASAVVSMNSSNSVSSSAIFPIPNNKPEVKYPMENRMAVTPNNNENLEMANTPVSQESSTLDTAPPKTALTTGQYKSSLDGFSGSSVSTTLSPDQQLSRLSGGHIIRSTQNAAIECSKKLSSEEVVDKKEFQKQQIIFEAEKLRQMAKQSAKKRFTEQQANKQPSALFWDKQKTTDSRSSGSTASNNFSRTKPNLTSTKEEDNSLARNAPSNLVSGLHSLTSLLNSGNNAASTNQKKSSNVPKVAALKMAEKNRLLALKAADEKKKRKEALLKKYEEQRKNDEERKRKKMLKKEMDLKLQKEQQEKDRKEAELRLKHQQQELLKKKVMLQHRQKEQQKLQQQQKLQKLQQHKQKQQKQQEEYSNYEISDNEESDSSDESDSENESDKNIPQWAQKENLSRALGKQFSQATRIDPTPAIFPFFQPTCDLEAIFESKTTGLKKKKYTKRTSSANWLHDRLTLREKSTYTTQMKFQ